MKRIGSAAAAVMFVAILVVVLALQPRPSSTPAQETTESSSTASAETVVVGGVRRPATDITPIDKEVPLAAAAPPDVGENPAVPADANADVRSVAEALREKNRPERLSVLHQPKSFKLEEYLLNKETHLTMVEPGRVFQPAQPGVGVPVLQALTPRRQKIDQGQSVTLSVKTLPEMPVTFTSFDLGAFENKLTSVTVAADAEGVATTTFTGTPGTHSDVNILAASPVAAGQARFIVHVVPPAAAE